MNEIIEISEDVAANLQGFIGHTEDRPDSYGKLTIPELVEMLLKDVDVAMRDPNSQESELVKDILISHGYHLRDE